MTENPVLWKELRVRTRSRQARPVRAAALCLAALVLVVGYYYALINLNQEHSRDNAKTWWQVAVGLQAAIIWLVCPALAVNAITQEKEQQTWEMLVFTLLAPVEILLGKLVSRLLPVVLWIGAFAPFMAYCFALGGASLSDMLVSYGLFAVWTAFLVTASLFMSWAFRKTATAVAMSYMVLFALTIGTALLEGILSAAAGRGDVDSPVIWLNPVKDLYALFDPLSPHATAVLVLSSATYLFATALLFWFMATRFRASAVE